MLLESEIGWKILIIFVWCHHHLCFHQRWIARTRKSLSLFWSILIRLADYRRAVFRDRVAAVSHWSSVSKRETGMSHRTDLLLVRPHDAVRGYANSTLMLTTGWEIVSLLESASHSLHSLYGLLMQLSSFSLETLGDVFDQCLRYKINVSTGFQTCKPF